jgi:hypothetical protein
MKEIIEINNRLLGGRERKLWRRGITLHRETDVGELGEIGQLRSEIEKIRAGLNRLFPDDFNYGLDLGDDEPGLCIEYDNGGMCGASRPHPWKNDESVFDQLREIDWDAERAWAISQTEIFDEMVEAAKHIPEDVPSTKALRKVFRDDAKRFVKEQRRDSSQIHVLSFREDEGLSARSYEQFEHFMGDLPNLMTCHYHVVSVVMDGKPLRDGEIDELKRQALKKLEDMPISHAQASGRLFGLGILGEK